MFTPLLDHLRSTIRRYRTGLACNGEGRREDGGEGEAGQRGSTHSSETRGPAWAPTLTNNNKAPRGGKASWHVLAMRKQGTGLVLNVAEASAKRRSAHARPIRGRAKWRQRPIKGPRRSGGPRRRRALEGARLSARRPCRPLPPPRPRPAPLAPPRGMHAPAPSR